MRFKNWIDKMKTSLTRDNFRRFLDKQGFYIVLFICICIIGATAVLTRDKAEQPGNELIQDMDREGPQLAEQPEDDEQAHETDGVDIKIIDVEPDLEEAIDPVKKDNTKLADSNSSDNKEVNQEEANQEKDSGPAQPVAAQEKQYKLSMGQPVDGDILKEYAMDELLYSKTLKEWATHPGVDIGTFIGAEVKAAMAGTVEEILEDPLMGIVITLDHDKGVKTRYANLSTGNMVIVGQKVEKGQIISGIGRTAAVEILDEPHLHFEVILDGENVNPAQYLD